MSPDEIFLPSITLSCIGMFLEIKGILFFLINLISINDPVAPESISRS